MKIRQEAIPPESKKCEKKWKAPRSHVQNHSFGLYGRPNQQILSLVIFFSPYLKEITLHINDQEGCFRQVNSSLPW